MQVPTCVQLHCSRTSEQCDYSSLINGKQKRLVLSVLTTAVMFTMASIRKLGNKIKGLCLTMPTSWHAPVQYVHIGLKGVEKYFPEDHW